jgi:hypothetical protein
MYKSNLYYISYIKFYNMYKNNKSYSSPSAVRRGLLLLQVRLHVVHEAGGHDLHRLLHSFPGGGLRFWYGAL